MPCICGNKVERGEPHKILCILCQQYVHWKCFKIESKDFELIKSKFKCKSCLTAQRSSPSTSRNVLNNEITPTADNIQKSNKPAVVRNCKFDDITCDDHVDLGAKASSTSCGKTLSVPKLADQDKNLQSAQLKKNDVSLAAVQNPNNMIAARNCKVDGKTSDDSDQSCSMAAETAANRTLSSINVAELSADSGLTEHNTSHTASMNLIYNELISLKKSNQGLTNLVKQLLEENSKLNKKIDELQLSVKLASANTTSCSTINGNEVTISSKSNNFCTSPTWANIVTKSGGSSSQSHSKPSLLLQSSQSMIATKKTNEFVAESTAKVQKNKLDADGLTSAKSNYVKTKKDKSEIISGSNNSGELDVFVPTKFKWVHISSFKNTVSAENVINYIAKQLNIDCNKFVCHNLVKREKDISSLKFVNFKLGVNEAYYKNIFDPKLWPANIKVRPFNFLSKDQEPNLVQQTIT